MKSLADSLLAKLLTPLARVVCRHPRWFVWPQVVLFGLSVWYTIEFLEFDTSRNNLVGQDKKYHRNYLAFKKEFPAQDDLVVVAESESPEKNRQFVERLGAKLEAETNLFTDVFYRKDLTMLGSKALLFVPEPDLEEMQKRLKDYLPFIQKFATATNLLSLVDLINTQFRSAKREDNAQNRALMEALPMLERIIRDGTASLAMPGVPPSPGIAALFNAGPEDVYLTFDDVRIFLVTTRPRLVPPEMSPIDTEKKQGDFNARCVQRLRQLVSETQFEVPGLNVGITGEPVLELDEMAQSQHDSAKASIVSLILCALIFIYGYRQTGRPVKATLCLIIGLGYTMAFTTATVGHLNILTITFVPILIGLAIDFGVHLVTRYEEEMRHGAVAEAALVKAMVFTGQGVFTGALTTAAAFWAMAITNFKGIQEMGIICGGGIMVCLIPMMTMLPALLLRGRQNVIEHTAHDPEWDRRARIEQIWLKRPGLVLTISVTITALALMQAPRVYFDYNLLNMQSKGLPAVEFEKKLIHSASKSVIFAAVLATNSTHAVELEKRIQGLQQRGALRSVANVESMSAYLTEDSSRKLGLIGEIKRTIEPIHFAATDLEPVRVEDLSSSLWSLQGLLGAALNDLDTSEPAVSSKLTSLREAILEMRQAMLAGNVPANSVKLALYQQALFNDVRGTFAALQNQDNSSGLRVDDLPEPLRNRFIGISGKQMLQVYPAKDVWKRENQVEFVTQLRQALDPTDSNNPIITGTPVQLLEYTTLLKESYQEAAWYSLAAISIMVLLHFRSLSSVLLALLPVALGSIWMGGVMGWLGIPFNPANIMTLPLVVGIGVTNGIHILNRYAEEWNPGILAKSTGKAVLVSGLTTIAGFGSLTLAKHQGIQSLGFVMSIGVGSCMIAGLTFLPSLLSLRRGKEKPSADTRSDTGSGGTEV